MILLSLVRIYTDIMKNVKCLDFWIKVAKMFGDVMFVGTVTVVHDVDRLWHVSYDEDSDEEDMNEREIIVARQMYMNNTYTDSGDDNDGYY